MAKSLVAIWGRVHSLDRLTTITTVLGISKFDTMREGWRLTPRTVALMTLMAVMYVNDLVRFAPRIARGEFDVARDGEIITFVQTQGITMYRMYLLVMHRHSLRKLVGYIDDDFASWTYESTSVKRLLAIGYQRGSGMYRVQLMQLLAVCMLFIVRPLFAGEEHALPMHPPLGQLPWIEVETFSWYAVTYILQVIYLGSAISVAFGVNMFFFTLMIRACAHMEHMATDFDAIGKRHAPKTIKTFVERYNKMNDFIDTMNSVFSGVTAVQPLYAGISIITSLLVYDGTRQSISFMGIAITHAFELYIYCYVGNLAAEKSCGLGDKIYGSRWYELSLRDKKSVLQILQKCQKPFRIDAGIVGALSLEMFSTVMKSTYSMWAVVNQMR